MKSGNTFKPYTCNLATQINDLFFCRLAHTICPLHYGGDCIAERMEKLAKDIARELAKERENGE